MRRKSEDEHLKYVAPHQSFSGLWLLRSDAGGIERIESVKSPPNSSVLGKILPLAAKARVGVAFRVDELASISSLLRRASAEECAK